MGSGISISRFAIIIIILVFTIITKGLKRSSRDRDTSAQTGTAPAERQTAERATPVVRQTAAPTFARRGSEPWQRSPARRTFDSQENESMPECVEKRRCSVSPELRDSRWFFGREKNTGEDPWDR